MGIPTLVRPGEITEIVGRLSSGRTSLLIAALRRATRAGAAAALVDVDDAFDAVGAARARVDLSRPPSPIGRNTVHSMQSGLLYGYVGLVEGMVARFKSELGPETRVVGTGGLAEVMARETSVIEILAPWLTLDGLRMIYDMNRRGA